LVGVERSVASNWVRLRNPHALGWVVNAPLQTVTGVKFSLAFRAGACLMKGPLARGFELLPATTGTFVDNFEVVREILSKTGHNVESSENHNGLATIRTSNSRKFVPITVKLKLTKTELLVLWEYSDTKRVGWRQRLLGGYGEDFNQFILSYSGNLTRKVRRLSPEEWANAVADSSSWPPQAVP
jgi:hypothetical protein